MDYASGSARGFGWGGGPVTTTNAPQGGTPAEGYGREIVVQLGDENSPYPPLIDPVDAEPLRHWLAKNMTLACSFGDHVCPGVCALLSRFVDERPCLCPCHSLAHSQGHAS